MFVNLRELWLEGNELTGHIPTELSCLEKLDSIFLSDNKLSGPIPDYLPPSCRMLALDHNKLTGNETLCNC